MHYITLIYEYAGGVERISEAEHQLLVDQHNALQNNAAEAHVYLGASQLKPASTAVSVRQRSGEFSFTDGPFAESKELLVGYYLFDCPDLDAALHWAGMIPTASNVGVEVHPLDRVGCASGTRLNGTTNCISIEENQSLYALLNYVNEDMFEVLSSDNIQQLISENSAMASRARAAGEYLGGYKLMPPTAATSIIHATGQNQVVDGPFTEAKEVLLGLHVLACESMDKAIDYAKSLPESQMGVIEVRPITFHQQQGVLPTRWNSLR